MSIDALLRFGPVGTIVLTALPLVFVGRYAFGRKLARYTVDSRSLESDERAWLQRELEAVGLPVADVLVATGIEETVAALGGTPWRRTLLLAETALETATEDELTGLVSIAAGQHETSFPELYSGFLVVASVAFAVALGVDPAGPSSILIPALGPVLVSVPIVGFAVLRRRTYAVDTAAVRNVGRESVRAAVTLVATDRLPDWIPDPVRPKPSAEQRLERL